jgi:hypothetical protein
METNTKTLEIGDVVLYNKEKGDEEVYSGVIINTKGDQRKKYALSATNMLGMLFDIKVKGLKQNIKSHKKNMQEIINEKNEERQFQLLRRVLEIKYTMESNIKNKYYQTRGEEIGEEYNFLGEEFKINKKDFEEKYQLNDMYALYKNNKNNEQFIDNLFSNVDYVSQLDKEAIIELINVLKKEIPYLKKILSFNRVKKDLTKLGIIDKIIKENKTNVNLMYLIKRHYNSELLNEEFFIKNFSKLNEDSKLDLLNRFFYKKKEIDKEEEKEKVKMYNILEKKIYGFLKEDDNKNNPKVKEELLSLFENNKIDLMEIYSKEELITMIRNQEISINNASKLNGMSEKVYLYLYNKSKDNEMESYILSNLVTKKNFPKELILKEIKNRKIYLVADSYSPEVRLSALTSEVLDKKDLEEIINNESINELDAIYILKNKNLTIKLFNKIVKTFAKKVEGKLKITGNTSGYTLFVDINEHDLYKKSIKSKKNNSKTM